LDPDRPQYWHRFQIARLYRAYFDRQPDHAGWEYWNKVYSQGRSLVEISGWLAEGSEFGATGPLTDTELVAFVYREVLDREPEPEGLQYWVGQLQAGLERGELVAYFSESDEYLLRTLYVMTGQCHLGPIDLYRCWADRLPVYHWWRAPVGPRGKERWGRCLVRDESGHDVR
jgi:hypothetical protein